MPTLPNRGEIWLADLNPTRGHEQAGARPVLIISTNAFNHGPAGLVFVILAGMAVAYRGWSRS